MTPSFCLRRRGRSEGCRAGDGRRKDGAGRAYFHFVRAGYDVGCVARSFPHIGSSFTRRVASDLRGCCLLQFKTINPAPAHELHQQFVIAERARRGLSSLGACPANPASDAPLRTNTACRSFRERFCGARDSKDRAAAARSMDSHRDANRLEHRSPSAACAMPGWNFSRLVCSRVLAFMCE